MHGDGVGDVDLGTYREGDDATFGVESALM